MLKEWKFFYFYTGHCFKDGNICYSACCAHLQAEQQSSTFSKNVTDGLGQEMRALQRGCKVMSKENDKIEVASMVGFSFQMYVLEDQVADLNFLS